MSTRAVNRPPPAHPGPNTESHPSYNSRVPNAGLHDPGLQGPQDLGPHVSARPIMCVPVPPPPPFLHYQWPMPFSYNPFTGFPGMGYGMVVPPFPPPLPYMEAPAYVMPHPQFQPVDYRRLLHSSVPVPSVPHQHPNQPRRVRPPHTAPVRETMNSEVQTEPTQGGPGAPGEVGPPIISDSGHGTMSNSPSSSSRSRSSSRSSSHRQGQTEAEPFSKDFQVNKSCSGTAQGFNSLHPSGTKLVQSCTRKNTQRQRVQEMVSLCRDSHCNVWSVDSPDDMVLVCSSSQQEDEAVKERRASVPDILMSWVGASPQEVMLHKSEVLPKKDQQLPSHDAEVEKDKLEHQSPAEESPVVADGAAVDDDDDAQGNLSPKDTDTLFKIIRLPLALQELLSESIRESEPSASVEQPSRDDLQHSFDQPQRLLHNELDSETNPQADTSEITAYQIYMDGFQMKRKMNESIWSVESLAPFIPNKERLQQSCVFESKAIVAMAEQDENDGLLILNDNSVAKPKERRRSLRFSSSDSVLMSDNLFVFSTPTVEQSRLKKLTTENETEVFERRESLKGQSITSLSEKTALASSPQLQGRIILSPPTREEADERRSSEPEAHQSPNQESFTLPEQKEKSPRSSEQEGTLLMNPAEEEKTSPPCQLIDKDGEGGKSDDGAGESAEVRNVQLSVPAAHHTTAVSPSRGNLIDCGVQCGVMELQCVCEKSSYGPNKWHQFKYSDVRDSNCRAEGNCLNGPNPKNQKRNGQWKHRGQEKQNGQTDGYSGKPGRSRGGNGRNHRY